MRGPIERRDADRARRAAGRRDVADLAPRVLAVVAGVLAVLYVVSGVIAVLADGPPLLLGLLMVLVGVGVGATARAAWRSAAWAPVVGAVVGLTGAVVFGVLVAGFSPDPDGDQVEQDLASFLGLGLFVFSLALFIAGAVWLVAARRSTPGEAAGVHR